MRDTCPKEEYTEIDEFVLVFAKEILSEKEILEANQLSEEIASSKKRKERAILKIRSLVGFTPKRPMFYLNHDLKFLPRHTRNPMRDLGDYIDHLIKFLAFDKLGDEKRLNFSLGANLRDLKNVLEENLRQKLMKYNELLYTPAKHDFNVKTRRHRFTGKEVVFSCFITLKLGKEIINLSESAKGYAEMTINDRYSERYDEVE